MSTDGKTRNQIDFITINERFRNAIRQAKSYPGADCDSDHNPVISKLYIRFRRKKVAKSTPKLDYTALRCNANTRQDFILRVQNRFEVLKHEESNTWDAFKKASVTTAIETLPTRKKPNKKPWMTEEILKNMKERQEIKDRRSDEYRKKANMIRRKCRNAKEIWLNEQCSEIERMKLTNPKEMYDRIKALSGRNSQTCSGCIRAKD